MKEIIFTKYSNDRSSQYAIRTTIELQNGEKYICKKAMSSKASTHIYNLVSSKEKLDKIYSESRFTFAGGMLEGDKACFPFVHGQSVSEKIVELLNRGEQDKAVAVIRTFAEELQNKCKKHRFEQSNQFCEVFGEVTFPSEQWATDVCDIDLIFENIIDAAEWTVIDYEWTFAFDIPLKFVLYRAIYYLFKENDWDMDLGGLYALLDISDAEIEIFAQMEQNFQKHVSGGNVPLYCMREKIDNPLISVGRAIGEYKENSNRRKIHVYMNRGEGYNEQDSYYIDNAYDKDGRFAISIQLDTDVTEVRIDPIRGTGLLYIENIVNQEKEPLNYYHNGRSIGSSLIHYEGYDSQLYVMLPEDGKNSEIIVRGSLELGTDIVTQSLSREILCYEQKIRAHKEAEEQLGQENGRLLQDNACLENKNALLAQEIANMKATKAWKFYEKYRRLMRK